MPVPQPVLPLYRDPFPDPTQRSADRNLMPLYSITEMGSLTLRRR